MFTTYEVPAPTFYQPSEQANLEYSILSTILGNSPESGASAASPGTAQPHSRTASTANGYVAQQPPATIVNGAWPATGTGYSEQQAPSTPTTSGFIAPQYPPASQYTAPANGASAQSYPEYATGQAQQAQASSLSNYAGQEPSQPASQVSPTAGPLVQRQPPVAAPTRSSSATLLDRSVSAGTASWAGPAPSDLGFHDGSSVYKSVTRPYDYTEGYHFLMKHLPTR